MRQARVTRVATIEVVVEDGDDSFDAAEVATALPDHEWEVATEVEFLGGD